MPEAVSKWYVHYKPDGVIIGSEWTNNPSVVAGTQRLEVDEDVGNHPTQFTINLISLDPERIT